jgi:hypothetical protein
MPLEPFTIREATLGPYVLTLSAPKHSYRPKQVTSINIILLMSFLVSTPGASRALTPSLFVMDLLNSRLYLSDLVIGSLANPIVSLNLTALLVDP